MFINFIKRERHLYASNWYFFLRIYDKVLQRCRHIPLPFRYSVQKIRLRNILGVFCFRFGTGHIDTLLEIFVENEYGLLFSDQIGSISTVLDLGGNAGYSVRLWEQKYPDCRITVVEPDSANAKVCRNNIQIVQAESRIILLQACALGTSRNVWLDRSQPEWGYKATNKASPNEAPIRGMTLNEILVSSNLPDKIDLLKCDIEGAELELFRDCSDWISKFRFFAIETHTPYTPEQLVQDMQKNGCCVEVLQINNKIDDVLATVFAKAI